MWQPSSGASVGILEPSSGDLKVDQVYSYSLNVPGGSALYVRIMAEEDFNVQDGDPARLKSLWLAPAERKGDQVTGRFQVHGLWKGLTVRIGFVAEDLSSGYGGEYTYKVV